MLSCNFSGESGHCVTARDQNTRLIAAIGVIVAFVLRPAAYVRAPTITPTVLLQLYSIAGARPNRQADPKFSATR